jgi:hypothetical protein
VNDLSGYVTPVLSVVLAAAAAFLPTAFLTARRLRSQLQQEAEILERVPPGARSEMRANVKRRTLLLVSVNRYRPFTGLDLLALLGLIAGFALSGVFAWAVYTGDVNEDLGGDPLSMVVTIVPLMIATGMATSWKFFYYPWTRRARRRIAYVEKHLGEEEAGVVAAMVRIGHVPAALSGLAGIPVAFFAQEAVAFHTLGWLDIRYGLFIGAVLALAWWLLNMRFALDHDLEDDLTLLVDPSELRRAMGERLFALHAAKKKRKNL